MALEQPQRGKVEDPVGTLDGSVEDIRLRDVPAGLEYLDARILQRGLQILEGPARKVVVDHDLFDVLLRQLVDRVRADQARPPDDDETLSLDIHDRCPSILRGREALYPVLSRYRTSGAATHPS